MNRQLLQYDAAFGHRFVPGLKARVDHEAGGYLIRTNSAGFRCRHEWTRDRAPGVRRILLLGDSYTAGDGVSDKFRYGNVLETLVDGVEVYNLALPGTGTDQQYLVFRELAPTLDYDLVLIGVFVENIRRVVARYRPWALRDGEGGGADQEAEVLLFAKPYFTLEADGLALHHVPVPKDPLKVDDLPEDEQEHVDRGGRLAWARSLVNRLGARDVVQRLSRYQPLPAYDTADDPDWGLMRAILERWIGEAEAPVLLCPIPLYQHIEESASADGVRARFAELADATGCHLHDPLDDFWRVPKAERRGFRFEHDTHFTRAGHRTLAESLAPRIQAILTPQPSP